MKFDRKEAVTGADLTEGVVMITVPRSRMTEVLERLE